MAKRNFHSTRDSRKAFMHGVQQGMGPFGKPFPRKKPDTLPAAKKQDEQKAQSK